MTEYGGFFPDGQTPSLMDMLLPGEGRAELCRGIIRAWQIYVA